MGVCHEKREERIYDDKKVDMIVKAFHFYTMGGDGAGYKTGAAMSVDGSSITEFMGGRMHTACNVMRSLSQDTNNWMIYGLRRLTTW